MVVGHSVIESNPGVEMRPETTGLAPASQVSGVIKKLQCQVFTLLKALYTRWHRLPQLPAKGDPELSFGKRPTCLCGGVCVCVYVLHVCICGGLVQGLVESLRYY